MTDQKVRMDADELVDANLFETFGPIHISFSRTSIAGVPLVSYRDAELSVRFSGDDITVVPTPVGDLVVVTLENVADAFIRNFALVVPTIRMPRGSVVDFETIAFETTDTSGAFVRVPGPEGVLQTYRIHQLRGSAQQVAF